MAYFSTLRRQPAPGVTSISDSGERFEFLKSVVQIEILKHTKIKTLCKLSIDFLFYTTYFNSAETAH